MGSPEFELIEGVFANLTDDDSTVITGIGDDAAVVSLPHGDKELVVCVDTLVEGVHFPADVPPQTIGYKSLAVNISDIAAMGAVPKWATLALTIPENNPVWLKQFSSGFAEIAKEFGISLIGGDTTKGRLTISVQLTGVVDKGRAVLRSEAKPGDIVFVTGKLGEAAIGLDAWQKKISLNQSEFEYFTDRLNKPYPQQKISQEIRQYINSAIDISDGLSSDLSHIVKHSSAKKGVPLGAKLFADKIPLPKVSRNLSSDYLLGKALNGGDDYQLCFTAGVANISKLQAVSEQTGVAITAIGEITNSGQIVLIQDDKEISLIAKGYDHFSL
ncbi:MAG: thiamine-phosphate kinase [Gammaproteobacteria bacterium]|nr:MAG: thiamine-phosphate kinase [Gammaproteobacteria bacterium]